MSVVYTKEVIEKALSQVGYQGETYASKYSKELDAVKYYNGAKTGATTWCAIFVDWCCWSTILDKPDANFARSVMCEPNYDNCGAGCVEKANYFKDAGRWYPHKIKGCPAQCGDQIFFKNSSGKIYHTGIVVDWDNKYLYTVEGSTGGAKVLKRSYSYSDSKIAGFGRPKYTGWLPDNKPEPTPEPTEKKYRVSVGDFLAVRTGPSTDYKKLGELYDGAIVTVIETSDNWGKITGDLWVSMSYLKQV